MVKNHPEIYLNNLQWKDWSALYKIARHPKFFYRALNDKNAWVAWRTACYIFKARTAADRIIKALRLANTNELVGCVLLADFGKPIVGQADTGIFVAYLYQRQGIGKVAKLRFLDWCLEKFSELQVIEATAHPNNTASLKIQERMGMKVIGSISVEKSHYYGANGQPEPRVVMRATRPEIEAALRLAREQEIYSRNILVR